MKSAAKTNVCPTERVHRRTCRDRRIQRVKPSPPDEDHQHLDSQSRGAQRSRWTTKLRPDQRAGLRTRTAGSPAAAVAARSGIHHLISAACNQNQNQAHQRAGFLKRMKMLRRKAEKLHRGFQWTAVRKRTVRVMMMVRAAADETMPYRRRLTCCHCTRTRVRSLAGPGPAGPNAPHEPQLDLSEVW